MGFDTAQCAVVAWFEGHGWAPLLTQRDSRSGQSAGTCTHQVPTNRELATVAGSNRYCIATGNGAAAKEPYPLKS
jgi:hypothetical protein